MNADLPFVFAIACTSDTLDVERGHTNETRCLTRMKWRRGIPTITLSFKPLLKLKPRPLTSTKASAKLVSFDWNPIGVT